MTKTNNTGRSKRIPGGYVRIEGYMLDSPAWKALSPYAQVLYMAIKRRFRNRGKGKSNNGYISMSRREAAAATGRSEGAMGRAFHDLIEKGFIKITRKSAFNMKDARAREYALTEFPVGDNLATKEFMQWSPEKQNTGAPETPVTQIRRTKMGAKRPSRVRRKHPSST